MDCGLKRSFILTITTESFFKFLKSKISTFYPFKQENPMIENINCLVKLEIPESL